MTTPWEVIEQALARKRPPRGPKWLADELGESIQTVSNWKARGVPFRRFRQIADALGVTVDQLEGLQPLPWDRLPEGSDWPFSDELLQKCLTLTEDGLYRLETVMRAHLGMNQHSAPNVTAAKQFDTMRSATVGHHRASEEGTGLPEDIALPAPNKHDRSTNKRQAHKGGRGSP